MFDISIVTHNSEKVVRPLIKSLVNQEFDLSKVSLLVYDNASSDQTVARLDELISPYREKFRKIIITSGKKNLGFGNGHNAAVAAGDGEFIFILNPDTVLPPSCLRILCSWCSWGRTTPSC